MASGAPPTTIVPFEPDRKTNLFPMHSPDGQWIAFSRGKGGHGDLTAQLWLVPAKGGTPVELVNGNRVVSNAMGDGLTENSQPTWAPPGDYHGSPSTRSANTDWSRPRARSRSG